MLTWEGIGPFAPYLGGAPVSVRTPIDPARPWLDAGHSHRVAAAHVRPRDRRPLLDRVGAAAELAWHLEGCGRWVDAAA